MMMTLSCWSLLQECFERPRLAGPEHQHPHPLVRMPIRSKQEQETGKGADMFE
jgi:hypothetical protein